MLFGSAITWLKIIQTLQVGGVLESSRDPLEDGHRDFQNWCILGWEIDENESPVLIDAKCRYHDYNIIVGGNFLPQYIYQTLKFLISQLGLQKIFKNLLFFGNNLAQLHKTPNIYYYDKIKSNRTFLQSPSQFCIFLGTREPVQKAPGSYKPIYLWKRVY